MNVLKQLKDNSQVYIVGGKLLPRRRQLKLAGGCLHFWV